MLPSFPKNNKCILMCVCAVWFLRDKTISPVVWGFHPFEKVTEEYAIHLLKFLSCKWKCSFKNKPSRTSMLPVPSAVVPRCVCRSRASWLPPRALHGSLHTVQGEQLIGRLFWEDQSHFPCERGSLYLVRGQTWVQILGNSGWFSRHAEYGSLLNMY